LGPPITKDSELATDISQYLNTRCVVNVLPSISDSSDVDHMGFSETDAYFQDAVSHILEDEEIGTTDTQSLFSMNSVATDDSRDSVNSGSAAPRAASSMYYSAFNTCG